MATCPGSQSKVVIEHPGFGAIMVETRIRRTGRANCPIPVEGRNDMIWLAGGGGEWTRPTHL